MKSILINDTTIIPINAARSCVPILLRSRFVVRPINAITTNVTVAAKKAPAIVAALYTRKMADSEKPKNPANPKSIKNPVIGFCNAERCPNILNRNNPPKMSQYASLLFIKAMYCGRQTVAPIKAIMPEKATADAIHPYILVKNRFNPTWVLITFLGSSN